MSKVLHLMWKYFTFLLKQRNHPIGGEPELAHSWGTTGKENRRKRRVPPHSPWGEEALPFPAFSSGAFWIPINESFPAPGFAAPTAAPQFQFSLEIWKCFLSEERPSDDVEGITGKCRYSCYLTSRKFELCGLRWPRVLLKCEISSEQGYYVMIF